MEFKDYYKVMGVSRDASPEEIKSAHRQLARKYHPDVNKDANAETLFKDLGEAYEVLKDAEKRTAYDQLGSQYAGGQDFRPPPDWNAGFEFSGGGFTGSDSADYSDFFESLFGRGFRAGPSGRASYHAHGADRHARVLIDLEDSYLGATRMVVLQQTTIDDEGRAVTRDHKLNVNIPKGVHSGQHIRLAGQGTSGVGQGKAGDLYLEIEFRPHPQYHLSGRDVTLDLPVAPWEAALGTTVKVPTPDGTVELKVPPESTSGTRLRLKGRGIPGNTPGDLYVVLQIALPPAGTEAAQELYLKMAEDFGPFDPRAKAGA